MAAAHPGRGSLPTACRLTGAHDGILTDLLHQMAYLHGTMLGRHCLGRRRAARLLVSGARRARRGDEVPEEQAEHAEQVEQEEQEKQEEQAEQRDQ